MFFLLSMFLGLLSAAVEPPAEDQVRIVSQWCRDLSHTLRSVNENRCLKREWSVDGKSGSGHVIPHVFWGVTDSETHDSTKKGRRILILGAMHGDEIASVSVVFRWMDFLERTKHDSFLRQNRYLFFPLVNPDGFYAHPRARTNTRGVDLNRNFETKGWNEKAFIFWKQMAHNDQRRYPGTKGGSEPETQVIQKWINAFNPDLIVSIHAPYRLIDHDGPIEFPNYRAPLPVRTLGAYPGSLGTYAGLERSIPVVTPELPGASTLPSQKTLEDLFLFIMRAKY